MGNFVVGMPRASYKGAFSEDASSSKLIGSGQAHNDILAQQLAGRLSQRTGLAVFCSCSLDDDRLPNTILGGEVEISIFQSQVVGLVEREVGRLLLKEDS